MRGLLCLSLTLLVPVGCGLRKQADSPGDSADPTAEDCSEESADQVDWLAVGEHPVGQQVHTTTSTLGDTSLARLFIVYYPALSEGDAAEPDEAAGPFPVVFFEHAGGAHYLDYETLFSHLASHGVVVVSIDHNEIDATYGWGSDTWWEGHELLFLDTIDEVFGQTTGYANLVDAERMGLAGHSHGAVLRTMQQLGPLATDSDHTIQAVSLLAPCPDEAIDDYLDAYGDMAPLQVIYGSRDQDGCVAYGQSIAVFEAARSPRHFVHLVGGSHYGFTDSGDLYDATISREAHQQVAAASLLAWWRYTLEADRSALPYLRGDRPLVADGPEIRNQFLDADPFRIDDFTPGEESTGEWVEVPVITGIEGQTYVNGFLSDSFADSSEGTALVRAEIASLLDTSDTAGEPAQLLYFVDGLAGLDAYGTALDELEALGAVETVRVTDHGEFVTQLGWGAWDLVISATQTGSASDENASDASLADWICGGGHAIVSDYRMDSTGAASVLACSLTAYDESTNYEEILSDGELFDDSLTLYNPGWGFYAVGLQSTGASVFAHALVLDD
ncbi:MAG: hypothetical protein QGG40_17065, partial [Myxococcota bacterium]|nr:hypothetical protein [Myxococcota bacterium]